MKRIGFHLLTAAALLAFLHTSPIGAQEEYKYPDPKRWTDKINEYKEWDSRNAYPENAVLFAGSSSIVGWKTAEGFPDLPVMNRGFGGSYTAELLYYVDTLVIPYAPKVVVIYEGDNDIAGGIPPARVHEDMVRLVERIHEALPKTHIIYLPAKLCHARWDRREAVSELNRRICEYADSHKYVTFVDTAAALLDGEGNPVSEYFLPDQLHLNDKGYTRWNELLGPVLADVYKR